MAVTLKVNNDHFKVPGDNDTDLNVLRNDRPHGALTVTAVTDGEHGLVAINSDGTAVTYSPDDPTFTGKDQFTYTAEDDSGNSDTATVKVTIKGTGCAALSLSDVLSSDHGVGGGGSSHAAASVSMASSSIDIDTLVHHAQHHVG